MTLPARTHSSLAITLVRHGEPALSRREKLSAKEYGQWWQTYEETGLLEGQAPPPCLLNFAKGAAHIFCSTRPRAIQSAEAVCSGRDVEILDFLIEAPLPAPPVPEFIKLRPTSSAWGAVSRIFWHFIDFDGVETRKQAEQRAKEAAEFLMQKALDGEILVLAHGYINHMIAKNLKRAGYRKTLEQGYKYWACRRFEIGV